ERIEASLEVLPFVQAWELVLARDHLEADSEPVIHDGDRGKPLRVARQFVLPDLLEKIGLRGRAAAVTDTLALVVVARVAGPLHGCGRGRARSSLARHRMAVIYMVHVQMRRAIEA